jgi:hypothetical protein
VLKVAIEMEGGGEEGRGVAAAIVAADGLVE